RLGPLMAAAKTQDKDIRKFEEIGTHPRANHNAMAEALTFHEGIGPERKAARLRSLKDAGARRVETQKAMRVLTPEDPAQSCGLALSAIEGVDPGKLGAHLWDKHRILCTPIGHEEFNGIRVTPNVYTTTAEIDLFCDAVEKAVRNGVSA